MQLVVGVVDVVDTHFDRWEDHPEPTIRFLRVIRNGAGHDNRVLYTGDDPRPNTEWRGVKLTNNLEGAVIFTDVERRMWGTESVDMEEGFIEAGDALVLTTDVLKILLPDSDTYDMTSVIGLSDDSWGGVGESERQLLPLPHENRRLQSAPLSDLLFKWACALWSGVVNAFNQLAFDLLLTFCQTVIRIYWSRTTIPHAISDLSRSSCSSVGRLLQTSKLRDNRSNSSNCQIDGHANAENDEHDEDELCEETEVVHTIDRLNNTFHRFFYFVFAASDSIGIGI